MVLLILAAIWAVVLIPPWVHSRREVRPTRSMVSFQRRLSVLERATPQFQAYSDDMYLDVSSLDELGPGGGDDDPAGGAGVGSEVGLVWDERVEPVAQFRAREIRTTPVPVLMPRLSSRLALQRRRQIFFTLFLAASVSLGAAVAFNTIAGWAVHGALSLLFLGYIALLVRHHQRAMDRSAKVRYLTPIRAPRPAVVVLHGSGAR